MFTLEPDTKNNIEIAYDRRPAAKTGYTYLAVSVFCLIFGVIYEHFSHEVYSNYMMYAFLIPLLAGCVLYFLLALCKWHFPGKWAYNLYNAGIAAFTVGSLFKGALDIYGTTNHLIIVYLIAGTLLTAAGICLYITETIRSKARPSTP